MAIISYPIFHYRSRIDFEMNFVKDLSKLGICCSDLVEKSVQEKVGYPDSQFTVIITKVVRYKNGMESQITPFSLTPSTGQQDFLD